MSLKVSLAPSPSDSLRYPPRSPSISCKLRAPHAPALVSASFFLSQTESIPHYSDSSSRMVWRCRGTLVTGTCIRNQALKFLEHPYRVFSVYRIMGHVPCSEYRCLIGDGRLRTCICTTKGDDEHQKLGQGSTKGSITHAQRATTILTTHTDDLMCQAPRRRGHEELTVRGW